MATKQHNDEMNLAWQFIEGTDVSVFLTGKAGTGKTTFLKRIRELAPKRMVVVAPTGVAAINAQGVTIHSFFQLPLGVQPPLHLPPVGGGLQQAEKNTSPFSDLFSPPSGGSQRGASTTPTRRPSVWLISMPPIMCGATVVSTVSRGRCLRPPVSLW